MNHKIELRLQALELEKAYLEHLDSLSKSERRIILKTLQMVNMQLEKEK